MGSTVCSITVKTRKDFEALAGYCITDEIMIDLEYINGKSFIVDESFEMDDTEAEGIVSELSKKVPGGKIYFFTDYLETGACVIHYFDGKQQDKFVFDNSDTYDKLLSHRIGSKEWLAEFKNALKEEKKRLSKTKEYTYDSWKISYQLNRWDTTLAPEEAVNKYYFCDWDEHPEKIRKITFESKFSEYSPGYFNQIETDFIALEELSVTESNTVFASYNGVLYSKDMSELIQYPRAKKGESYVLPKETRIISEAAFLNVENLKQLILPNPIETYQIKWEERHADIWKLEGAPVKLEYHLTPVSVFDFQGMGTIKTRMDNCVEIKYIYQIYRLDLLTSLIETKSGSK